MKRSRDMTRAKWLAAMCTGAVLAATVCGAAAQTATQQRKIVATGAVAEIDDANNTITFTGGAKLTTNEGTISAREIEARLGEGNAVETAQARGDVKLDYHYTTKGGLERIVRASADKAIYRASDRVVQLVGNVTGNIVEPARERNLKIAADEVTFWIDEGRLRLRPALLELTEVAPQESKTQAPPTQ